MSYEDRSRRLAREMFWEDHDRDTYQCPDCGRAEDELRRRFEVHHEDGRPLNNTDGNRIALCPMCHCIREGRKPSMEDIKHFRQVSKSTNEPGLSEPLTIYLAGAVNRRKESSWRSRVISVVNGDGGIDGLMPEVEFADPRSAEVKHGGETVSKVAGEDMQMVERADAVVAFLEKPMQPGTLTEASYALGAGKPVLAFFHIDVLGGISIEDHVSWGSEVDNLSLAARSRNWFFHNMLSGDGPWEQPPNARLSYTADVDDLAERVCVWLEGINAKLVCS